MELRAATPSATITAAIILEAALLVIPAPSTAAEGLRCGLLILETGAAKITAAGILPALEALIEPLIESLTVPTAAAAIVPAVTRLPARITPAAPIAATETAPAISMAAIEAAA